MIKNTYDTPARNRPTVFAPLTAVRPAAGAAQLLCSSGSGACDAHSCSAPFVTTASNPNTTGVSTTNTTSFTTSPSLLELRRPLRPSGMLGRHRLTEHRGNVRTGVESALLMPLAPSAHDFHTGSGRAVAGRRGVDALGRSAACEEGVSRCEDGVRTDASTPVAHLRFARMVAQQRRTAE